MKIQIIKKPSGYKDRIFSSVKFPCVVSAKVHKTGLLRGFASVTRAEMEKVGEPVARFAIGFENDHDHGFDIEPCAWREYKGD